MKKFENIYYEKVISKPLSLLNTTIVTNDHVFLPVNLWVNYDAYRDIVGCSQDELIPKLCLIENMMPMLDSQDELIPKLCFIENMMPMLDILNYSKGDSFTINALPV